MKNLRRSVRKWTFVLPRPRIALGEKFQSRFDCPSRYNQCHHLSLLTKVACEEEDGEANFQGSRLPKNNTPLSLFMEPHDLKLKNIIQYEENYCRKWQNRTLRMVLNNTCWRRARCRVPRVAFARGDAMPRAAPRHKDPDCQFPLIAEGGTMEGGFVRSCSAPPSRIEGRKEVREKRGSDSDSDYDRPRRRRRHQVNQASNHKHDFPKAHLHSLDESNVTRSLVLKKLGKWFETR